MLHRNYKNKNRELIQNAFFMEVEKIMIKKKIVEKIFIMFEGALSNALNIFLAKSN